MEIERKIYQINSILDEINSTGMGFNYSAEMAFTEALKYTKGSIESVITSSLGKISPYMIVESSKKEIYYDLFRTIKYQGEEGNNHPNLQYIKSDLYHDAADMVLSDISSLIEISKTIYSFKTDETRLYSNKIEIYYPVHWGVLYAIEFENCAYTVVGYATD